MGRILRLLLPVPLLSKIGDHQSNLDFRDCCSEGGSCALSTPLPQVLQLGCLSSAWSSPSFFHLPLEGDLQEMVFFIGHRMVEIS